MLCVPWCSYIASHLTVRHAQVDASGQESWISEPATHAGKRFWISGQGLRVESSYRSSKREESGWKKENLHICTSLQSMHHTAVGWCAQDLGTEEKKAIENSQSGQPSGGGGNHQLWGGQASQGLCCWGLLLSTCCDHLLCIYGSITIIGSSLCLW